MNRKRKMMIGVAVVVVGILIGSMFVGDFLDKEKSETPKMGPDIDLIISTPPKLNETSRLQLIINDPYNLSAPFGLMAVIWLPQGFICVDGNTIWAGNITNVTVGQPLVLIDCTIKAVETGNWTIGAIFYPQMIENLTFNASTFSFENISYVHSFFVKKAFLTLSISEDSAEITDYQSGPPFEKHSHRTSGSSVSINLSISNAPHINQTANIICTLFSHTVIPNTNAQILLPEGFALVDGNLSWQGNLTPEDKVELNATIKSVENGNWAIEAYMQYDTPNGSIIGGRDYLYLTVLNDSAWMNNGPPFDTSVSKKAISFNSSEINYTDIQPVNLGGITIDNSSYYDIRPIPNSTSHENQTSSTKYSVSSKNSKSPGTVKVYGYMLYKNIHTRDSDGDPMPESCHPYTDNYDSDTDPDPNVRRAMNIYHRGATSIGVHFKKIEIESGFDHLYVMDGSNNIVWQSETDYVGKVTYEDLMITVYDSVVRIRLKTDDSVTYWGFKVDYYTTFPLYLPARGVEVQIWDDEYFIDIWLGTTLTNENGYFECTVANDAETWPDGGTADIYVRALARSSVLEVGDGTWVYDFYTKTYWDVSDGTLNVGRWYCPSSENGAWQIYDTILYGFSYMYNAPWGGNSYKVPKVPVTWPASTTEFNPTLEWIYIKSGHAQCADVVLHEYGHHVMYNIYGNWLPSAGGTHQWDKYASSKERAWAEGWADFFFAPVQIWSGHGDRFYDDYYQGFYIDLEAVPWWTQTGDQNEGSIAAALYDIYDSDDEFDNVNDVPVYDTFDGGFGLIWDVIRTQTDSKFSEFWSAWKSRYSGDTYKIHYAKVVMYRNKIDYNLNAPTCTVTNLGTGWYKGTITLSATASDTDSEDTSYLQVEFQYSTDHTNWILIGIGTTSHGVSNIIWDASRITDDSVWVRARAFDGMEYSSWDECNSSFKVDNTAPTSNVNTISPYWQNTSPLTITATASDATSGVKNVTLWYRYSTDNTTWGGWVLFGTDTVSLWSWSFNFPNGTGYYQFYTRARDNATNYEAPGSADAICGYDNTIPTSNANAISPYWQTISPITITATASDTVSGLASVELWYRYSADNTSWGAWTNFGADTVSPWSWSFTFPNGTGYYQFYSRARDNATNYEAAPGSADAICGYDNAAPTSNVNAISPYWQNTSPVTITATASDTGYSGLASVELWYRYSTDNSSGGGWVLFGTDTASPWSWSFTFPNGTGYYQFYNRARDNATNYESAPTTRDTLCGYDNTPPSSYVIPLPAWSKQTFTVSWTGSDLSGIASYDVQYKVGSGSWVNWLSSVSDTSATFTFGEHLKTYYFRCRARDNAGNVEGYPTGDGYDTYTSVDAMAPEAPALSETHCGTGWTTHDTPYLTWNKPYDDGSGVSYYSIVRNGYPIDITSNLYYHYSPLDSGTYIFNVYAVDNAGNEGIWSNSVTVNIDITPPESSVNTISLYWFNSSITITASASDLHSGVASVELWHRYSTNNATWGSWTLFGTDTATPWSWNFTFPNSDGYYQFYSRARDNVTNYETAPGSADAICGYDKTPPSTPVLQTPENGNSTRDRTPTFTWQICSDNIGGSGVGYYNLQVMDASFTVVINLGIDPSSSSYTPPRALDLEFGVHYWQVRTVDNAGNIGDWSETWSFTVHRVYGVDLEPEEQMARMVSPGATVTFTIVVTNTGNDFDTITLTPDSMVNPKNVSLDYDESASIVLTVTAPSVEGAAVLVIVNGSSQNDSTKFDNVSCCVITTISGGGDGGGGGGIKIVLPIRPGDILPDGLIDGFDIGIAGRVELPGMVLDGDLGHLPSSRNPGFCINRIIDIRRDWFDLPGFLPHPWYCEVNNIYQLYYVNVSNPFNSTIIVNLSIYGVPEGWDAYLSNYSITLEPDEYIIVTLTVVIPKTTTIGQTTVWVLGTIQDYDYVFMYGINVTVGELPVAIARVETSYFVILENDVLVFNGSYSFDPDGTIFSYEWDFGDGTNGTGMAVEHSYENAGNYAVTLIVRDNYNLTNSTRFVVSVERHSFEVNIQQINTVVRPGGTAVYMINIKNTGTISDTYMLRMNGLVSSWGYPDSMYVGVSAGGSITLYLKVTVPSDFPLMYNTTYNFTVTVTCMHDQTTMSNAPLACTADETLTVIATKESKTRYMINEVEELITLLDNMSIQQGIKNSLKSKLENALNKLNTALDDILNGDNDHADNMLNTAQNQINAFINEVEAQRGKKINDGDADMLLDMGQTLINHINETMEE
ncbi:MAG: Ig-like domain-containing protein [Thermoplasmatales archaeon]|nr:Ig-like domain-containing protein [Thermoplasmatales archaeon]